MESSNGGARRDDKYSFSPRLSHGQLARKADELLKLLTAIENSRQDLPIEQIGIFRARTLWGAVFPPKRRPKHLRVSHAIPFGEGDYAGMLAIFEDGLHIAVPLGKGSPYYRTHTVDSYVEFYLTAGNDVPAEIALSNINSAKWHLEQLLPDGHELKKTPRPFAQRVEPV